MHRASLALGLLAIFFVGIAHSASLLPTEQEIQGIKAACGGGNNQSVEIRVNAALADWRKGAVNAGAEAAKKDLAGALGQVKNDSNLAPVYKIYVDCIKDTIQQFIEREAKQPKKISASGRSHALLRSAFISDEGMEAAGCEEATANARRSLAESCAGRVIVQSIECPSRSGSPRTYTSTLIADCFSLG